MQLFGGHLAQNVAQVQVGLGDLADVLATDLAKIALLATCHERGVEPPSRQERQEKKRRQKDMRKGRRSSYFAFYLFSCSLFFPWRSWRLGGCSFYLTSIKYGMVTNTGSARSCSNAPTGRSLLASAGSSRNNRPSGPISRRVSDFDSSSR